MSWSAITLDELNRLLEQQVAVLDERALRLWKRVRVPPKKWRLSPEGDEGGGFWIVGLIGRQVLWYNDVEDGFNVSSYIDFGEIGQINYDQAELRHAMASLLHCIDKGESVGPFSIGVEG